MAAFFHPAGCRHALRVKADRQIAEGREDQRQHDGEPPQGRQHRLDGKKAKHADNHGHTGHQNRRPPIAGGFGRHAPQKRVLHEIQHAQHEQNRAQRGQRYTVLIHEKLRRMHVKRQPRRRQHRRKQRKGRQTRRLPPGTHRLTSEAGGSGRL
jgi:hypothetical protein